MGDHHDGPAELVDGAPQEAEHLRRYGSPGFPVGSSPKMISGRAASARATATRCCCPPESWVGPVLQAIAQTDRLDDRVQPRAPACGPRCPWERDVLQGVERRQQVERLEDEADPVPAQLGEPLSLRPVTSVSSRWICPEVTVSRPARQCISVDLPEPEGPMIAVNWPRGMSTSTWSRATTRVSPEPYALTTCRARGGDGRHALPPSASPPARPRAR